ncbi:N-acetyltransferase family protein [Sedimentibacter sp.]|uniref:GNAT family N-acetyltransferase n=1 Tax=Sedimentibacter sp. TaxID=1960295 RepID=UPI0028AF882D|nr:N-acetyltransferase family protein [Sedimentibacter sp.]
MKFEIKEMKSSDWEQVKNIYLEGIKTGIATFQSEFDLPSWEKWNQDHINSCRLVAILNNEILGWAALSPTSKRLVYSGVAEVSIYIKKQYSGHGVGTGLLNKLIVVAEKNGFWTLQSGIIRENTASIELHKKCGFRVVGIREKLGKMENGIWHDVVLMERRSKVIGIRD